MLSFTHLKTHVLTSHVEKLVKFLLLEAGNMVTTEFKIAFWMYFYCFFFVMLSKPQRKSLGYRNIKIFWVSYDTFLPYPVPPVSLFVTFHFFQSDLYFTSFEFKSFAFKPFTVFLLIIDYFIYYLLFYWLLKAFLQFFYVLF